MNKTKKTGGAARVRIAKDSNSTNKGGGAGAGLRTVAAVLGRPAELDGGQMIVAGLLPHAVTEDITGRQGAGKGKGRKARAVGVGRDAETQAADGFAVWVASSPRRELIGAACMADASGWRALQVLARRAARRAAQRLQELRGVNVSDTSRDDAAADAVNAVAMRFPSGCLALRNFTGARVRILARIAGGAAFKSLSRWSVAGMTGRDGGKQAVFWSTVFDVIKHKVEQDSIPLPFEGYGGDARRAACRWVYRVGLVQFKRDLSSDNPGARATAISGARRRCRVVASVLLGQSLFDSCAVHGFGSVAAFVNSCERAGLFASLRYARGQAARQGRNVREHRAAMRANAKLAALACLAMRAAGDAGAVVTSAPVARVVSVRSGAARVVAPPGVSHLGAVLAGVASVHRAPVARIIPATGQGVRGTGPAYLGNWASAAGARAFYVELAVYHRDAARAAMACDLAAFDRVLAGVTSEDCDLSSLRRVFGITDKLGRRRNGSKIDASGIRRGKGSVSRPARIAATVAATVATRYGERELACAPVAPAVVVPWAGLPDYIPAPI